jgi:hypothetical protein
MRRNAEGRIGDSPDLRALSAQMQSRAVGGGERLTACRGRDDRCVIAEVGGGAQVNAVGGALLGRFIYVLCTTSTAPPARC